MTNLNPTPGWDDVPQLEETTVARGGPGGPMNTQAQALLNRTEKLNNDVASVAGAASSAGTSAASAQAAANAAQATANSAQATANAAAPSADLANASDATKGAALVARAVARVDAITAAASTGLRDGDVIHAKGRSSAGDGGGGVFIYYASSTQTADGGIIFAPATGDGRFIRDGYTVFGFNGRVHAKWFGVKGDNSTDDTSNAQSAANAVYAMGGGELFFGPGTYLLTSVSLNFASAITVNVTGAGKKATVFKKTGGTTTPIFNWSANTGVLTNYSDFRDFSIVGNAKAHDGIYVSQCARFSLTNVDIGACASAINSSGSLVFQARSCTLHDNATGYKCAKSANNIYANLVAFYDCQIIANSSFAADLNHASGVFFFGCDIEANGQSGVPSTGAIMIRSGISAEIGYSQIHFSKCWFEVNNGTGIQNESTGNPAFFLSFRDTQFVNQQSGLVAVLNSTAMSVLFDNCMAPSASDTLNLTCGRSDIRGGLFGAITDASAKKYRSNVATSGAGSPFTAIPGASGGITMLDNGNTLIGPTAAISGLAATLQVSQKGNTYSTIIQNDGTGGTAVLFATASNGGVGSITTSSTATAYNTSSDYRLKEIDGEVIDSGDFIDSLRPKRGRWKADGSPFVGFLAHEVQEVSPTSVTGEKDAVFEDGRPNHQSVFYGSPEIIANMVAELQSLRKRVAELEQLKQTAR